VYGEFAVGFRHGELFLQLTYVHEKNIDDYSAHNAKHELMVADRARYSIHLENMGIAGSILKEIRSLVTETV